MPNDGVLTLGDYTIQATGNITIQSEGELLQINAPTSMDGGGNLAFNADTTATLSAGDAFLMMSKDSSGNSSAALHANQGGSISFTAGSAGQGSTVALCEKQVGLAQGAPVVGPRILLEDSKKLTLEVGPPGVGSSIELTPDGIKVSYAQWSLAINATGIKLNVGPSSLSLSPDKVGLNGLTVNLEAITQAVVKGLLTQITGDALTQVKGGITTLG